MRINFKTVLAMFLALFFGACIYGKRPEIVRFKATPGEVRAGETVNVSWDVSRADACQLSGIDVEPVSGYRDLTVYPPQDFTLQCWNANGVSESTITINVIPEPPPSPPVVFNYAYASPNPVPAGGTVTLYWSAINADYCLLDDYGITFEPTWAFQISSVRDENAMHVVTCANAVSSVSRSIIISIIPQPAPPVEIGTFTASPASIVSGATTTLIWTGVTNATSCNINNGVGPANIPSGSKTVSPTSTTTYILNCTGAGTPATRSVTVTVTPPPVPLVEIILFAANPVSVVSGQPVTLTWTVSNATSCTIDNGTGAVSPSGGTVVVVPVAPTTYTLSCSNSAGSRSSSIHVNVTVPSTPSTAPDCNAFPNPPAGTSVISSWCAKRDGLAKFYCETVDDPVNFVPKYNVCTKSLDTTIGAVKLIVATGTDVGVAVAEAKPALRRATPVMICALVWVPSNSGVLPRTGIDWFQTTGSPGANYLDAFGRHWNWSTNTWVNVCLGPGSEVFSGRPERWPGGEPTMFVPPSPYGQFAGGWMQFLAGLTQGMGSAGAAWVSNLTIYGIR